MDQFLQMYSRDGSSCGMYMVATTSSVTGISYRIANNIKNNIALNLNDKSDYINVIGNLQGMTIDNLPGRGLIKGLSEMNKIRHIQIQGHGRAILLCLMLFLCINVGAQSNGGIVIGGDVYGGGHNGAVGTDNASTPAPAKNKVKMKADSVATIAASVTVYDGTIRSIFGGGENGRTYGSTSVTVEGANTVIGRTALRRHH